MAKKKQSEAEVAKLTNEAGEAGVSIEPDPKKTEGVDATAIHPEVTQVEVKPEEEPEGELAQVSLADAESADSEDTLADVSSVASDVNEDAAKNDQSGVYEEAYLEKTEGDQELLNGDSGPVERAKSPILETKSKKSSARAKPGTKPALNRKPKPVEVDLEPQGSTESASYADPIEAIEELAQLHKQLPLNVAAIQSKKAKSEDVQGQRLKYEEQLGNIASWIAIQEESYFWKAKQVMDQNLTNATSDLKDYEAEVKTLDIPDAGELVTIRESFHKNLGKALLAFLIPTVLLLLIPWASREDMAGKIVRGVNSGWLIPALVIALALYLGVLGLVQRGLNLQNKKTPWKKLLIQWAIILGVVVFILLHFWAPDFMRSQVTPLIESIRALTITALSIALFFAIVGLLLSYYSKWSEFRRRVVEQYNKLENVVNGYIKTKQEIARLENVYQQLNEWLEVLAHSVYRPWKVNPEWKTKTAVESLSETMPRALRVAEAIESENAETAKLEKLISDHLLVQGWRNNAFEDSLKQLAAIKGLSAGALAPSQLDRDLPHQPNNTRKLTLEAFRGAAMNPDKEGSSTYLKKVARSKVGELVARAQKYALSEAQPKVELIVKDPLRTLVSNGVEENSMTITSEWDEFLSKNLGLQEIVQPPLSVLGFTNDGIMREMHKPISFVLAPEKLIKKLEKLTADSVRLMPVEVDVENPRAEIVVRIDVTPAVSFENIKLLSAGAHKAFTPKSELSRDERDQDL